MIDNNQRQMIRALLSDPKWGMVEQLANALCVKIKDNSPIKETVDQTILEVGIQEGKVQGIRLLLQELYKTASDSK